MKHILTLLSFSLLVEFATAQQNLIDKIDTSNYYNYFSHGKNLKSKVITTAWLSLNDAVPIVMQELKNANYDWLYDHCLFKVSNNKYVVLAGYSRKSNIGFLYIQGHEVPLSIDHRNDMTEKSDIGVEYVSCEETPSGKANFVRIEKLPSNIFVLNENNYWYQYTDNPEDSSFLVTKEAAIKILRQDIKKYLSQAPKP